MALPVITPSNEPSTTPEVLPVPTLPVISYTLPCEADWTEGIYQIATTDRVKGYDPATGEDGVANLQWLQLGNRTLYLRNLLAQAHIDGKHFLTNADFLDTTKIPESALQLTHGTQELQTMLTSLNNEIAKTRSDVDNVSNIDLNFTGSLSRIVPYSEEYFEAGCNYELFNGNPGLHTFSPRTILSEIAGDDSLDISSTKDIEVGETYFLLDTTGERVEEITVLTVLTEQRIRVTRPLKYTRTAGLCTRHTLVTNETGAVAHNGECIYLSELLTAAENATNLQLFIHHAKTSASGRVQYKVANSAQWQDAEYQGSTPFLDGTFDDVWLLPATPLTLRISYTGGQEDFAVDYLALKSLVPKILIEDIRRPTIVQISLQNNILTVQGDDYASLYAIDQAGLEIQIQKPYEFSEESYCTVHTGKTTRLTTTLNIDWRTIRPLWVKMRYFNIEWQISRWSPYVAIGV